MRDEEIMTLKNHRNAVIERERVREQIERFGTNGAPSRLHSLRMNGMPRGTNDRASAERQRIEYLEDQLRTLNARIEDMANAIQKILRRIEDVREYAVIESYYLRGNSDEWMAITMDCSIKTVYRLRRHALEKW